jgi:hypothetical protein
MNGHQNDAFSCLTEPLKRPRNVNGYGADYAPVNSWYEYIAENSVADAMLDRLFNGSHHIDLTGPSMRKGSRK